MVNVVFNELLDYRWWICILISLDLMFSVIMKRVPLVTNFERPIYRTFNQTNLVRKQCETLKI